MIRILVDADLILEILMNRQGFVEDVSDLLDRVNPLIQMYITDVGWQKISSYVSCLQNTNIADVVATWLKDKVQICSVDQAILQQARRSSLKDFESAVELLCVRNRNLDAVVTHNYDNFAQSSNTQSPNKLWVWSVAELWVRARLESQFSFSSPKAARSTQTHTI